MIVFITKDSSELNAFIRHTKNSNLLLFKYLTKTEIISLNHEKSQFYIKVTDVKSVESYTIELYLADIIVAKFHAQGIGSFTVNKNIIKINVITNRGKIYLQFKGN